MLTAMLIFPDPFSTTAGAIGLTILSIVGAGVGGKVGDELSGLNKKKRDQLKEKESSEGDEVSSVKTYSSGDIAMNLGSTDSNNIIPVNVKKELNVASAISNSDESPQITYLPIGGVQNSKVPAGAGAGSSKSPSDSLPTIPSSDFANTSIALSESIYNVVV